VTESYLRKWSRASQLDDECLKGNAGGSCRKELPARIRDIRFSEKMLYRQCLIYMPPVWTMIPKAWRTQRGKLLITIRSSLTQWLKSVIIAMSLKKA
jgi:hypothetical protein